MNPRPVALQAVTVSGYPDICINKTDRYKMNRKIERKKHRYIGSCIDGYIYGIYRAHLPSRALSLPRSPLPPVFIYTYIHIYIYIVDRSDTR